jgi:hypothetical protein
MRTFSDIARVVAMVLLGYLTIGALNVNSQVQLPPYYKPQFLDQNGRPLSNGCVFTYISGTNTPQATFTDFTGSTPNPNPILLDGSGRPPLGTDIWLGSGSYRFKLVTQGGSSCSTGVQQWLEDGITSSTGTILSANNTFTGTNTFDGTSNFNGPVNMNVGFTSNGPSNLSDGGSINGTFSGSPTISGVWFVTGGMTFNVPWTSLVTTGTPPFSVNSTSQVANLNASFLEGVTWEAPDAIGGTTPNAGTFTTLVANTELFATHFSLSGTAVTGIQGSGDPNLLASGTITSGAGRGLCLDANGGATTTGCATSGFTQIEAAVSTTTTCPTSTSASATCGFTISWPTPFVDTSYAAACIGVTITGNPFIAGVTAKSTSGMVVEVSNGTASAATASGYAEMDCTAVHP